MSGQVWATVKGQPRDGRTFWTAHCYTHRQWRGLGLLRFGTHNAAHMAAAQHNREHRAATR